MRRTLRFHLLFGSLVTSLPVLTPHMNIAAERIGLSFTGLEEVLSGYLLAATNLGAIIGPLIAGALTNHLGFTAASGLLAIGLVAQVRLPPLQSYCNSTARCTAAQSACGCIAWIRPTPTALQYLHWALS